MARTHDATRLNHLLAEIHKEINTLKGMNPQVTNATDKLLVALKRTPGRSRGELVGLTGLSPIVVSKGLQTLQMQGHVVCLGIKRAGRWYPTGVLDAITAPKL